MKKLYFALSVLILALVTLLVPAQPGGGPIFVPPRPASDYIASNGGSGTNVSFWGTVDFPAANDQVLLRDLTAGAVLYSKDTGGDNPSLAASSLATSGSNLDVPGVLVGSATGNDVKTHERYQFANRADTTVTGTSEATLTNATASGSVTIPAGYLTQGSRIKITLGGTTANPGGGVSTFTAKLSGTSIWSTTVDNPDSSDYYIIAETVIRTTGVTGAFKSRGQTIDSANGGITHPSGSGTIDTTTAKTIDVTYTSGTGTDTTCEVLMVTIIRP